MTIYLTAAGIGRDNVVIAQREPDGLRFTCYDERGPAWDTLAPTLEWAMRTVREYRLTLRADGAEMLDDWSQSDAWRLGVAQAVFLQAWNVCARHNRYDLGRWLDGFASQYGVERAAQDAPAIVKNVIGVTIW